MLGYIAVLIFFGVFGGAHEEHVFEVMSESLCFHGIHEGSDSDAEGGCRFLCVFVGDDEALEVVFEAEGAIDAFVADALDDLGDAHN